MQSPHTNVPTVRTLHGGHNSLTCFSRRGRAVPGSPRRRRVRPRRSSAVNRKRPMRHSRTPYTNVPTVRTLHGGHNSLTCFSRRDSALDRQRPQVRFKRSFSPRPLRRNCLSIEPYLWPPRDSRKEAATSPSRPASPPASSTRAPRTSHERASSPRSAGRRRRPAPRAPRGPSPRRGPCA